MNILVLCSSQINLAISIHKDFVEYFIDVEGKESFSNMSFVYYRCRISLFRFCSYLFRIGLFAEDQLNA